MVYNMADFSAPPMDVQKYLAEKAAAPPPQQAATAAPPMDVSQYLKEKSASAQPKPDVPWYQIEDPSIRNKVKGVLNALPTAGMMAGAAVGTPADVISGPMGTVAGAAVGGAVGKTIQNAGEHFLLGEDKTRSQIYGDPAKEALSGATAEMGGQVAGKAISAAANTQAAQTVGTALKNGASKVGELFTGVPDKVIQTYAKYADEIKGMAKASDNNSYEAADQLRSKWADQVQQTRQGLNSQIATTLKGSTKTVDSTSIIDALNSAKSNINEKLYPEQISQIDDLAKKIGSLADDDGQLSVSHANEVKRFLQDQASSAYKPGALFPLGSDAAKAAKSGAAAARNLVNTAEPAVATANSQLANLHDIEDSMNLNMLKEGKPEASIIAAGTGGNPRNAQALQRLSDATGGTMSQDADKLAAMGTFGSPKLMAADSTGKAAGRIGLAAGIGFLTGGPAGAVIASAMTSPMALRTAIDAGKIGGEEIAKIATSPAGRAMLSKAGMSLLPGGKWSSDQPAPSTPPANIPMNLTGPDPKSNENDAPLKGEDKWVSDGIKKALTHDSSLDPTDVEDFSKSRSGRALLIQASDLKPGSPAMEKLVSKIRSSSADKGDK